MKKLVVVMMLTAIGMSIAGCGAKTDPKPPVETAGEETPKEQAPPGIVDDSDGMAIEVEQDDIWKDCLEMDEMAVLDGYPEITVNGVAVDPNWTLRDFLATDLAKDPISTEAHRIIGDDQEHLREMMNPSISELEAGFVGADTFLIYPDFTVSFAHTNLSFEDELSVSILDAPMSMISMTDNFDIEGIAPNTERTQVATILGPTRFSGEGLTYICDEAAQSWIEFDTQTDIGGCP